MSQLTELELAFQRARIHLLKDPMKVFFSSLVMLLPQEIDTHPDCDTACTDGKKIYYSSQYFMGLGDKEFRSSLMAHEAMHVALKHMMRVGNLDPEVFNEAADHVINLMLKAAGFRIPNGWLCDHRFNDMHTAEVYKILMAEKGTNKKPDNGSGNEPKGDIRKPKPDDQKGDEEDKAGTAQEEAKVSAEIDSLLQQASQMVAMAGAPPGSIPGEVQVYLDGLLKPKLPMAQHLRRFFQNVAKNDYSWRKINRRFKPMLLPGMASTKLSNIAFAFDMSISVSEADIKRYVSELYAVLRMLKPDKLTLILFDTRVVSVTEIKSVRDLMKLKLQGRGGTSIHPVMDWAKKNKPTALVVFTDGEYAHPNINPGCPILWMIHGYSKERFNCSFGTTIKFDV